MSDQPLEKRFSEEELKDALYYINAGAFLLCKQYEWDPNLAREIIEGLRPYARDGNAADMQIRTLMIRYRGIERENYTPPLNL